MFLNNLKPEQMKYFNPESILSLSESIIKECYNINWLNFSNEQKNILNKNTNFFNLLEIKKKGCPFDYSKCNGHDSDTRWTPVDGENPFLTDKNGNRNEQQIKNLAENISCYYGDSNTLDKQIEDNHAKQEPCYCSICNR